MIILTLSLCLLVNEFLCCARFHNFSLKSVENDIQKVTNNYISPEETGTKIVRSINSSLGNQKKRIVINFSEETNKNENGTESNREGNYNISSEVSDHPYLVLVLNVKFVNIMGCSGSILTKQWVLTSAECIQGTGGVTEVYVYAGGASMEEVKAHFSHKQPLPHNAQLIHARELIIHPNYNIDVNRPDIALIRLEDEFKITSAVNTIRLSTTPWQDSYGDGLTTCQVSKVGNLRRTFITEIKKPCYCYDKLVEKFGGYYAEQFLCSQPIYDRHVCDGIGGAGLVCDGEIRGVSPMFVEFKDIDMCEPSTGTRPEMAVCKPYDSLVVYEDTCPFVKWINIYTQMYTYDELAKCAAESPFLHLVVQFLLLLMLWIW